MLYGKSFVSYNAHGLVHLVQDVRRFGPLDSFSAFPYENNIPVIEQLIHSHNRPLQQFVLRFQERKRNNFSQNRQRKESLHAWGHHENGPIPIGYHSNQSSNIRKLNLVLSRSLENKKTIVVF